MNNCGTNRITRTEHYKKLLLFWDLQYEFSRGEKEYKSYQTIQISRYLDVSDMWSTKYVQIHKNEGPYSFGWYVVVV